MHPTSSTTISENIEFIGEAWDNMHNWLGDTSKRKQAVKMLAEFRKQIGNKYWITDDEELFLDTISHTIESYC